MNLSRLTAALVLSSAFLLAACGNKADLFMPPPPDDDELVDDWDDDWDGEEEAWEEVDEGEPASQDAADLPLPVPTGDE